MRCRRRERSLQVLFVQPKTCNYIYVVKFVDINGEKIWSVIYDGETVDVLTQLFRNWNDLDFLEAFFKNNREDLASYFKITDIDLAIYDTLEDANELRCMILDISPDADIDKLFRHLENSRIAEMLLGREKAKDRRSAHDSWLRIYALRLGSNTYLVTGGAIKLTRTMEEREHTLNELKRMEQVRNYLIEQGAVDLEGVKDIKENE